MIERTGAGARFFIEREHGVVGPFGRPDAPWNCAVLESADEVAKSLAQVRRLGLPPMADLPKNWDSLAALDLILRTTDPSARVFDAGGEWYSMILPWLFLYGYRHLTVGNLVFEGTIHRGSIVYEHSDLTRTKFTDGSLDVVTCLSVIEHGVDLEAYFREMSRILRSGGLLVTSTDYLETPVDTRGQVAYGVPIHVFSKEEIERALTLAARHGFALVSDLALHSKARVVRWEPFGLRYTFVVFALRKA
jgi:SAM-dependent methyltransferase